MTTTTPRTSTSVYAVAERFIALCNQGKNFEVMGTMYAPNIVSVEGEWSETKGQAAVIKKSEDWVALNTISRQTIRGPYFNGAGDSGGQFAVHFVHEVTQKATGQRTAL